MARAAGLLGERQRISNAKPCRKAKSALGIESIRHRFGAGGGLALEIATRLGIFGSFVV